MVEGSGRSEDDSQATAGQCSAQDSQIRVTVVKSKIRRQTEECLTVWIPNSGKI